MTEEAKQSFIDIVRQFALDLGLPKVDVDKLVATHKKNFEALTQTAQIATDGVKSVAAKQKETIESAFREAVEMARATKLVGDSKEMLAKQTAAVNRAVDAAVGNTRDIAERIQKANADTFKVVADRITESLAEIRRNFPSQTKSWRPSTENGSDARARFIRRRVRSSKDFCGKLMISRGDQALRQMDEGVAAMKILIR
jgi:phasin family protein